MADENEVPPSATGQMPRVRRRAPTIDLKATEIAVDPPPEPHSTVPPDYPTEPPAYETEAAAEPPSDSPPPQQPPEQPPQRPASDASSGWPIVLAGLAGGLAALLIFGLLWLGGMFAPSAENPSDQRITLMEARLRDMANRPVPPQVEMRIIEELSGRVARLESAPQRANGNPSTGVVEDAVRPVQTAVSDLSRRIDDNAAAVREARSHADAALVAADAARVAVEKTDLTALSNRIAALESASKSLAENVAKSLASADDKPLRGVVAAQALQAAVERGEPFAAELAAAKTVAPDAQALAPLEPFAASGLPRPAALSRELSQIAPWILKNVNPPQPGGGFLERLQANAEKLVRVRPVDEAAGDDPAAVVSRAEAKAARGDLAGAVTELRALPSDLRAPADDWIKKVEARTAAVSASRRVVADALASLGKSP